MKDNDGFKALKEIYFNQATFIDKSEDFYNGSGKGIRINNAGEIVLDENSVEGVYESPIVNTKEFKDLIGSWNGEAVPQSEIELSVQIKKGGEWSRWFSCGRWWSTGNSGSIENQKDNIALMDVDLIKLIGEQSGNGFRYKIDLRREHLSIPTPKIRLAAVTLNLIDKQIQDFEVVDEEEVELDLPKRSQMIVPEIGNVICSPTSLSMVLEYYGHFEDTESVAKGVYDYGAKIYGNWSYNVAYAGTKGFTAYVARFTDLNQIKTMLKQGRPLVASIRTKTPEELQGAPQSYPSGHLVAIRGFKVKDGVEYIIVNDPAALDSESVRREYLSEQFLKVWNGVVYCVFPNKDA